MSTQTTYRFLATGLALLALLSLGACTSAADGFASNANKFEEAGLHESAMKEYLSATARDAKPEHLAGLKRSATHVLSDKLDRFEQRASTGRHGEAIRIFKEAKRIQSDVGRRGLHLPIDAEYQELYEASCDSESAARYKQATAYAEAGDYTRAKAQFEKIRAISPGYRDIDRQLARMDREIANAEAARSYRRAETAYAAGKYRAAYRHFGEAGKKVRGYRDISEMQNRCLEQGQLRIAIFPFSNASQRRFNVDQLHSYVLTDVVQNSSAFLDVIDRNNLDRILREQNLGRSGIIDPSSAARAGRVAGLSAIVLCKLVAVNEGRPQTTTQVHDVYETYQVRRSDGTTELKGRPVQFREVRKSVEVSYELQYQIIDCETSSILATDIVRCVANDEVRYATYSGNYRKLSLTDPSDKVFGAVVALTVGTLDKSLFTARKQLASSQQLGTRVVRDLAKTTARKICGAVDR